MASLTAMTFKQLELFTIHEAHAIPETGQVFTFHTFRFEVLRKVRNRIASLKIVPATTKAE